MSLWSKVGAAKATMTGEYSKAGHYYIIIEGVKKGKHQMKGSEFAAFECRYLHILDKALWAGNPKEQPLGTNLPGQEPKAGEPVNFVFMDGVLGNENRLRKFIITAADVKDEEYPRGPECEAELEKMVDPRIQPLRGVVMEVKAGPQKTREKKDIIATNPLRRVPAEEIRQMWEDKKLAPEAIDYLAKDKRLEQMLDFEKKERANKAAQATQAVQ